MFEVSGTPSSTFWCQHTGQVRYQTCLFQAIYTYISVIRGIHNSPDTVSQMQCQRHWLCKKSSQDQAMKDDRKQTQHVDPELHWKTFSECSTTSLPAKLPWFQILVKESCCTAPYRPGSEMKACVVVPEWAHRWCWTAVAYHVQYKFNFCKRMRT